MDMLHQNEDAESNTAQEGNDLITAFIETVKEQKLWGGVAWVKQVFGDKAVAVKRVAQGVSEGDKVGWSIQRHQWNGDKTGTEKDSKTAKKQHSQLRAFNGFYQHPQARAPKNRKNAYGNVFGRQGFQQGIL